MKISQDDLAASSRYAWCLDILVLIMLGAIAIAPDYFQALITELAIATF